METSARSGRSLRREVLIGGAHLGAIWAIAIAQPLLDLLGKNPDFFVARSNTAGDIVILALGFTLLPPLVLLGIEALVALAGRTAYRALHFGLITILVAFLAVEIQKQIYLRPTGLMIIVALAIGALFAMALMRSRFLRTLMDVLAFAPIVILALFLFTSDSSKLIFSSADTGALGAKVKSHTPVVMIIMDEFPTATLLDGDNRIDARRFPNFARLAKHSTWYRNNTTVADFTSRAVPAILTGIRPDIETLPTAADQPKSIFSLLGGAYKLHVQEAVTHICSDQLCGDSGREPQKERLTSLYDDLKYVEGRLVLPPAIANTLPDVSSTFGNFGNNGGSGRAGAFVRDMFTPPTPSEFERFIDTIPDSDRTLSVLHMELPHEPWRYLANGKNYNGSPISQLLTAGGPGWKADDNGIATSQARHFIQTGYGDKLVGLLMKRLRKEGIWNKAMVIVTADHGISFQAPDIPPRVASKQNVGAMGNPPLFIKYPGQKKGKISPIHTHSVDIVPTIAKQLDVSPMYETDGKPISEDTKGGPVEITRAGGYTVKVSLPYMTHQRGNVVKQQRMRFGDGGLYRLGPEASLIGTSAPTGGTPTGQAQLDAPDSFSDVDPGSENLHAFITGTLTGIPEGTVIAVAVNGVIRGTSRSFRYAGSERFGSVADSTAFRPGANDISVYKVDPTGLLSLIGTN